MSGLRVRAQRKVAFGCVLAGVWLAGALLGGCATSKRQCSGPLEPINEPAVAVTPDQRDEP